MSKLLAVMQLDVRQQVSAMGKPGIVGPGLLLRLTGRGGRKAPKAPVICADFTDQDIVSAGSPRRAARRGDFRVIEVAV